MCELPVGVVVRLQTPPLWLEASIAVGATLGGACVVALAAWAVCSGVKGLPGLAAAPFAVTAAALTAAHSIRRVRRRLRGDTSLDTTTLYAADDPIHPVVAVRVSRGAVGVNLRRPVKLHVVQRSGDPIELPAEGAPEAVERVAAQLRRALRLVDPSPDTGSGT